MTPEEIENKAKDLFNKMKGFRVKHSHSKKCAIIAVDEIIENNRILLDGMRYHEELNYLESIKDEIRKL